MATKQRYQSPTLGDTIRLQNFSRNTGSNVDIKQIAKIEIFYLNENAKTPTNPEGRVLTKTIVNHLGQPATEIYPYPSASNAEYWETQLITDQVNWNIGKYVDRWHIVTDPDADLYGPAAVKGKQVSVTGSGATTLTLASVNRKVRINGISNGATTPVLSFTTASSEIEQSPAPTSNFLSDPLTIAGYLEDETEAVCGYFYAISNDGTTWSVVVDPNTSNAKRITAATATWNPSTYSFTFTWTFNSAPTSYVAHFWYVEEWQVFDLTYNPSTANPWDDLITRSSNGYVSTIEHGFEISSNLWFSSDRPVIADYSWNAEPARYYVGTKSFMKVSVTPSIVVMASGNQNELIRYYYNLLARSSLTYEIYRLNADSSGSRKIKSGTVDWHEENIGVVLLDTTISPLNRQMDAWIKFHLDIEGQYQVQSDRIFFSIYDDSRRGVA